MSSEVGTVRERVKTDPRISRRRRTIARLRRRRSLALAIAAGTVALSIWVALFSPVLHVGRIQVLGAHHVSRVQVQRAAAISHDTNLLLLSTTDVQRRVEGVPWVESARVERKLPGTVSIRIEERHPAMVLTLATSSWVLDDRGRVLQAATSKTDLPTIGGVEMDAPKPGDVIDDLAVAGGLRVWRSLPKEVQKKVDAILSPTTERISLALGQTVIRYGAAEHFRAKVAVLKALLARLGARGITPSYIDISVPTNPAVGPPATAAPPTTSTAPTPAPTVAPSPTPTPTP
ncbi:MAG TPA: FtsQ-type POTRA domain-containing protein [Actinomycetota bacterium]|nr:FtsQ-type POTRA domain-containing protein [Actinomycetota bacterium]